jgi:hypothetical protein
LLQQGDGVVPEAGDIVLAKIARIGQHPKLESPVSRRQALFVGDEILVPSDNRYAADQFLAKVPGSLVVALHAAMSQATQIAPVGLLADDAGVLNLNRLAPTARIRQRPTRPGSIARAVRYRRPDLPRGGTAEVLTRVELARRVAQLPKGEHTILRRGGEPLTVSGRCQAAACPGHAR